MCGISIAVNKSNRTVSQLEIKKITDKVYHRGPDDEGYFLEKNFAFGHRRLSILDLTIAGHQPMQREDLCITYNGEIYNYIELKNELSELGYNFTTNCDTEVILFAYKEWGIDSFKRMNGMWAFCIYDRLENKLVFSRDHFGIKPLYYTTLDNWFIAGSEIKQFIDFETFSPVLNEQVTLNFLTLGLLNYSEETFFKGVYELRPGHVLDYNLDTHVYKISKWYDLKSSCAKINDSISTAVSKTRLLFEESLLIRMRSDVKVGSCLSGGIDSSCIVTSVHHNKLANADFATITSCYQDIRYDEQFFSDIVSRQTKFPAFKVYPNLNDLWQKSAFDKILYHQDQPIATASHFSEFKVFETAREHSMIVMLDGQGSDEYLCGYGEFYTTYIKTLIKKGAFFQVFNQLKIRSKQKNTSFLNQFWDLFRNAFLFDFIKKVKKLIKKQSYPFLHKRWQLMAEKNAITFQEDTIKNLSITEIEHTSIPYQLHSEDRNSMLFSIESRLPFLDHHLVEYVIGLPDEYKIRNGLTKYILREAIQELPREIKERKDKMGFVAPDEVWIKENKDIIRKELEELVNNRNIFTEQLLHRYDQFINGDLNYEPIYFRAISFNRFCKIFKLV